MKKYSIFISVFLVFFSFTLTSFAQPLHYGMGSTKNDTPRVKLNLPTLDIMVSDDSVLIILNGVSDKVSDFEIYGFPEFSGPVVNSYLKKSDGEKVIWDIENIPKGNYFVYVIKKDNLNPSGTGTISTKTSIINIGGASPDLSLIYKWPLDYKIAQKNVIVSGKIDQNKYPYANESLKIRFKRSTDISKVGESEDIYIAKIADNGSYSAEISGLDPKSKYFLQQEILGGNPEVVLDTRLDRDSTFNSKDGNVLASSEEFSKSFDKRSYRLLAPWPGLSVVLDPSLCAEEKAAGRLDSNAICDINGLLNYLFKLLIGLTAVSLVLRIMFEGYQYIVTDIPFLKSSAKSHLSESFFGLVLALSAWMLLNTINPKLVSNSLNIKSVEVGIEELAIQREALEVQNSAGQDGTVKLCTDVASCKNLCVKYSNGSTYSENPPGVMNPSLSKKISSIQLVTANCKNCTASNSVLTGLNNLKTSIDSLISRGEIKKRNYTFNIVSGYRPAKDQMRIMCEKIYSNPKELGSKYAFPAKSKHGVGIAVDVEFLWDGKEVKNCRETRKDGAIEKIMNEAGFQRLNIEAWHFEYGGSNQTCKYPNCPEPKYCSL